jgi:hypothetical protein
MFFPAPKEMYIPRVASMVGPVVAEALWEMCQAYTEYGFGEAGEPEYLNNTKEVRRLFIWSNMISWEFASIAGPKLWKRVAGPVLISRGRRRSPIAEGTFNQEEDC